MKTFSYVAKKSEGGEVRGSLKANDIEEARASLEARGFSIRKLAEVEGPASLETVKVHPSALQEGPGDRAVSSPGGDHHHAKAQSSAEPPMKIRITDTPALHNDETLPPMKIRIADPPALHNDETLPSMKIRIADPPALHNDETLPPMKIHAADTLAAPGSFKFKEEPHPHREEGPHHHVDISPATPSQKTVPQGHESERHKRRGAFLGEDAYERHKKMPVDYSAKVKASGKTAPQGASGGFLARQMPFTVELVASYRELSAMYSSGISIVRGVGLLAAQSQHPLVCEAFTSCRDILEKGGSLSLAFSQNHQVFPPLYARLLHAAESSGSLPDMLERIAGHAEKAYKMQMNIRSALTYPIFVIALCLGLLIIGPAFTLKGLFDVLKDLDVSLPASTQFLIFASQALRSPFTILLLLILLCSAVFLARRIWSARKARKAIQAFLLRIPAVGDAITSAEGENFALTLSLLYESGIPLLKAMEYTEKSSNNIILQETIAEARDRLYNGCKLQDALRGSRFFPRMTIVLLAAGEESGEIGEMLMFASTLFRTRLESALDLFAALMQPIVLLIVGILVGFVVISTMTPMLKVMEGLF